MAAGLVSHNFTTSASVTFATRGWVPDTASPDVGVIPVALLIKSDGTVADPVAMQTSLALLDTFATPVDADTATATNGVMIGGTYNATPITLTDTQQAGAQLDASGYLKINVAGLDGVNTNGRKAADDSAPAVLADEDLAAIEEVSGRMPVDYEWFDASSSALVAGATGAVGDYLSHLLIVPASTSPGAVSITDGNGTARTVFAGGTDSVSNLVPFSVPVGAKCVNATTAGWKITTGTNVQVIAFGTFT